ncbi:MAG: Crp/Fnr family transcriptional regulator [Candidatus Eremiobacteraeota bacterium]|nr:Crp/Fnr family transcriptional regulator [Candidatus Eremiobacteraeota bacterium]
MKSGAVIYEVDERLQYVYFPLDSVMSMLSVMENGSAVEVGSVGREGMAGVQMVLGSDQIPGRGICQVPGRAVRMPGKRFTELFVNNLTFRILLQRYTLAVFNVAAQSVACNRLHPLAERCARWLLMTQDRVGKDDFNLTHEFLAMMLGVRRAGVSTAAAMLQTAGYIHYLRGHVTIIDRLGLEGASCECYQAMVQEYERLMHIPIIAPRPN